MAIKWGSGTYALGVDVSRTASTVSSETWKISVYLKKYSTTYNAGTSLSVSGAFSFSGSTPVKTGSTQQLLWSSSKTFSKTYGSSQTKTVSVSLSGFHQSVSAVSASFTVAARAYDAPANPSNVKAVYVETNKATVSWGKVASTGAPVSGFVLSYSSDGWATWTNINLSGSTTSWTSHRLSAGLTYSFAVQATGAGGKSDWVYSSNVPMTPLKPSGLLAQRSGTNVVLSWSKNSSISGTTFDIYEGDTVIKTGVTGTTLTVSSPDPAVPHTYKVRERSGSLVSEFVTFNTVQLLQAPAAPANLTPNGDILPNGADVTIGWSHTPIDGSDQTGFEVQFRVDGDEWQTLPGGSQSTTVIDPVGTLVEWQVRTKGNHADWSPWSATASFTLAARPTLTVTVPDTVETDTATVQIQPSEMGEYAWQAEAVIDGTVHATGSGYGESPFTWEVTELPNNTLVEIRARVQSEVWSDWATSTMTVEYAAPSVPDVDATWISETASVEISVTNPTGDVETVGNVIQSRTASSGWENVGTDIPVNGTFVDFTPSLSGTVQYRVGAVAGTGVVAWSAPVTPSGAFPCAHYLNFGDGFARVVVLRYNPAQSVDVGLTDVELVTFAGQTIPTMLTGSATSLSRSLEGTLVSKPESVSAVEQARMVRELAQWPGLVMARTIDDEPTLGAVSGVKITQLIWGGYQVSLTHTRAK